MLESDDVIQIMQDITHTTSHMTFEKVSHFDMLSRLDSLHINSIN